MGEKYAVEFPDNTLNSFSSYKESKYGTPHFDKDEDSFKELYFELMSEISKPFAENIINNSSYNRALDSNLLEDILNSLDTKKLDLKLNKTLKRLKKCPKIIEYFGVLHPEMAEKDNIHVLKTRMAIDSSLLIERVIAAIKDNNFHPMTIH